MQIKCLPRNLYRFYSWGRTQVCLDAYRKEVVLSQSLGTHRKTRILFSARLIWKPIFG